MPEIRRDFIIERIDIVKQAVTRLRRLAAEGEAAFSSDPDNYAIAEHNLRRAIQAVLDIGSHLISKKGLGKPRDYRDILRLLGQHGIMPAEFAQRVAGMAGYRNRLVHGYAEVTPEEMYSIISARLDDLDDFCLHIVHYVNEK